MKNLSIVFFFLMTFAFMSVNAQAQTTCQPKKDCKKTCSKATKATTQAKGQTNTIDFLNVKNSEKTVKKASCKPANCAATCQKKGAKATTTSVTIVKNETPKKEPVAALKPKSNE